MQLTEHIDLQEPLASLRGLLEQRMGMELADYEYWLQGVQQVRGAAAVFLVRVEIAPQSPTV